MTFEHLANLMLNWGWELKSDQYSQFKCYLKDMLRRDRVMIVKNGEYIEAIIIYYLTNDYKSIYKKSTWQMVQDESDGHQIYIDKMVCRKWTKELRVSVQRAIQEEFPQVVEAYYHRAPKDRCVKIIRGERYELQSTVS